MVYTLDQRGRDGLKTLLEGSVEAGVCFATTVPVPVARLTPVPRPGLTRTADYEVNSAHQFLSKKLIQRHTLETIGGFGFVCENRCSSCKLTLRLISECESSAYSSWRHRTRLSQLLTLSLQSIVRQLVSRRVTQAVFVGGAGVGVELLRAAQRVDGGGSVQWIFSSDVDGDSAQFQNIQVSGDVSRTCCCGLSSILHLPRDQGS